MQNNKSFWTGVGLVTLGIVLSSRPNCNRGCRTLAEHLAQHGVQDIVATLLA
jgi:hypothetical protein